MFGIGHLTRRPARPGSARTRRHARSAAPSRADRSRAASSRAAATAEAVEPRVLLASVWISDAVVTEGNSGTTDAVFTVTLFQPGDQPVTVNYATANNSATTPDDYTTTAGTLTFTPGGATSQTITVPVAADTLQESNELFFVNLSAPTNANIVGAEGRGYIADDDQSYLTAHNVFIAEGTGAAPTEAVVTVIRSGSTAGTTTVNYATSPGTATSPADFATSSGTLSFGPGVTTRTVTIPLVADALDEANENFTVSLTGAVNGTLTASSATVTVVDDDDSSFSIDGVAVREGTAPGTSSAVVTVTRHGSLAAPASVSYATANNSALAGQDFTQTTGTLNFAAGDASEQITIPITNDAMQEPDERFFVNLSNAQNAALAENQAEVWIADDDASSFVLEGAAVQEGDAGTTPIVFTVRRYGSLAGAATLNFNTSNSNATAPGDYAQTNGTITFNPGDTTQTITVQVAADNAQEAAEQFFMNISNPTNGTIVENQAAGVIVDDDESFFSIVPVTNAVTEGGAGSTAPVVFRVTRHGSLDGAASVNFATSNGTAVTPGDYAVSNGTLNFPIGETTRDVTVTVNGDDAVEGNEWFGVSLTNAQNAGIAENTAFAWIANDDGAVTTSYFFPRDVAVAEGDAGNVEVTFLVQRLGNVSGAASVNYTANNGTALQGQDFQSAAGTLSYAAGETEKSFTVTVLPDALDEGNETFGVSFSGAVGGTVADNSVQGLIVDDDEVSVYVSDSSTAEGDAAERQVRYTVTRFGELGGTSTVNWATSASSATTPGDFLPGSGTVTFAPGDSSEELVVRVVGDAVQESSEVYFVNLSGASNAAVVGTSGQGWIVDDDASVVYAGDVTITEGTGGTPTNATFTVTRFGSTDGTTTLQYAAINSSTQGADYVTTSGTLTFAPGEATKEVTVPVVADALQEASEVFLLDLTGVQNATVLGSRGQGRIIDDDTSYVAVSGVTVSEGSAGAPEATFTVTRFGALGGDATVEFRTAPSSASTPGDFTSVIQALNFAPGDASETVVVPIAPDTLQEANESLSVSLALPQNTTVLSAAQSAYIMDDDEALLYVTSRATVEGDPGSPQVLTFTVQRLGSLAGTTTVNFAAAPSSATTPADFLAAAGTLTFAPGVASQTFDVQVVGDLNRETLEEQLNANLSAVQNGTVVVSSAPGTILDDDPAPAVTAVHVSGSAWLGADGNPANVTFKEFLEAQNLGSASLGYRVPGGADQGRTIPWINFNRVSITFSQDVLVHREDLAVRGTNRADYAFAAGAAGFSYDPATRTATWTFDASVARDRIILDLDSSSPDGVRVAGGEFLDGEWTNFNDAFPSGNGTGGGDFLFRLNALPGDADRNSERVNAIDLSYVKARANRTATETPPAGLAPYTPFADVDGNGRINAIDVAAVKARANHTLPAAPAAGAAPASITRSLFGTRPILD